MKKLKYILFSILLSFIYINSVNATSTCVYDSPANFVAKFMITCSSDSSVSCSISTSYDIKIAPNAVSLKPEYFKNGASGNDICPNTIYISSGNNTITNISISKISDYDDALTLNASKSNTGSGSTTPEPTNPDTPSKIEDYESDSRYIEAKKDAEKYCDPTNIGYQDDAKCAEAQKKMNEVKALYGSLSGEFDPESFCKGPVQGVFTTLGWVFFVIKIVIPILLIIFGSIDVGKAVIASKDDEIKKSIKTLTVRVIAGIIVFFVPTILNLVVNLIDNSDVYKGTFWDCTKCMLDPVNNVCSTLRGGK